MPLGEAKYRVAQAEQDTPKPTQKYDTDWLKILRVSNEYLHLNRLKYLTPID